MADLATVVMKQNSVLPSVLLHCQLCDRKCIWPAQTLPLSPKVFFKMRKRKKTIGSLETLVHL